MIRVLVSWRNQQPWYAWLVDSCVCWEFISTSCVGTKFKCTIPNLISARRWPSSWWRHQMETFFALLALCAGNSRSTVNSPHKGQWRGALMFSLICASLNDWINTREAGDLRRYRTHYDVIVISVWVIWYRWPRYICSGNIDHCGDVTWALMRLRSPENRLFVWKHVQVNNKEVVGNSSHAMTSSWIAFSADYCVSVWCWVIFISAQRDPLIDQQRLSGMLREKTSYRKISWTFKPARFSVKMFIPVWNLAGFTAAMLPRCLSEQLENSEHQTMMTSSNGNIFRVTGPLHGEFIHRWISRTVVSFIGNYKHSSCENEQANAAYKWLDVWLNWTLAGNWVYSLQSSQHNKLYEAGAVWVNGPMKGAILPVRLIFHMHIYVFNIVSPEAHFTNRD